MLETIREYAEEELAKDPTETAVRHRHAAYFTEMAEQAADGWVGPDSVQIGDRLEVELDNLRAALRVTVDTPYPRLALLLASKLLYLWKIRGHRREGIAWLEAADAIAEGEAPELRTDASGSCGALAGLIDDLDRAREALERAMLYALETGDEAIIAKVSMNLAIVQLIVQLDNEEAIPTLTKAAAYFRETGDGRPCVLSRQHCVREAGAGRRPRCSRKGRGKSCRSVASSSTAITSRGCSRPRAARSSA